MTTTEICRSCAGSGRRDQYNPATKRIETVTCGACGGSGTVQR